jgi:hypothetical protein
MYQFSYLIADLALLIIWGLFFLLRKDVRKEMLFMSVLFGIGGLLVEYIYTFDWWHPLTITNTRVGIEDFLFGFWVAGIATIIYEEVFKKVIYPRRSGYDRSLLSIILYCLLLFIIFCFSFFILKLNSFYSSITGYVPLILFMWIRRHDLILDSLASGVLLCLVGYLWFWIPELLTPDWVKNHWLWENLSGIIILKVPLEDLIWSMLTGMFIGPLYEFWQGAKLKNLNKWTK